MDQWTVEALAGSSWAGGEKYYLKDQHHNLALWTAWPSQYTDTDTRDITSLKQEAHDQDNIEGVYRINDVILTGTVLYTVTDTSLADTCLDDAKHSTQPFTLDFLWSLLRQLTAITKRLSTVKTQLFGKKITSDTIYFDNKGRVTVIPFYPLDCKHVPRKCDSLMCDIGDVFKEILDNSDPKAFRDIRSVVKLIQGHGKACSRKPESILYHPTVLSHFRDGDVAVYEQPPKTSNDSAFESDESRVDLALSLNKSTSLDDLPKTPEEQIFKLSENMMESKPLKRKGTPKKVLLSPTVLALDLNLPGYVPKKGGDQMKVWRSRLELAKNPEEVTEEALNRVWLERLTALQEREEAVRQKELEMSKKKILNEISKPERIRKPKIPNPKNVNMSGATLQTAMTDKFVPGVVTRSNKRTISSSDTSTTSQSSGKDFKMTHRRSSSVRLRSRKKKAISYADMDSSLSADQGDTSVLPTSSKLTSDKVPRPTSIHNVSRRKVHFNSKNNPFAEYDSISSTTLTFFEIENLDQRYEIPRPAPAEAGSLAERIAKFTYLDLEEMTNKKRDILEELRKSPPKIDRNTKPSLQSKVKTANMLKKFGGDLKNIQVTKTTVSDTKPENRRKTICNLLTGKENNQPKKNAKDNFATPAPVKSKDKRKSILGFKTPFKFHL